MLVSIYKPNFQDSAIIFETEITSIRELLNYIKATYGDKITDSFLEDKYTFVGLIGEEATALTSETILTDLPLYEQLHIVPSLEGNEPITASIALAASYAGGMAATAVGSLSVALGAGTLSSFAATAIITTVSAIVEAAIYIGVAMGVSMLMSPDSSFSGDPSKNQKTSKMFNTALTINEQGGSVPLVYGNPFCGGVLISSGLTSELVTVTAV